MGDVMSTQDYMSIEKTRRLCTGWLLWIAYIGRNGRMRVNVEEEGFFKK